MDVLQPPLTVLNTPAGRLTKSDLEKMLVSDIKIYETQNGLKLKQGIPKKKRIETILLLLDGAQPRELHGVSGKRQPHKGPRNDLPGSPIRQTLSAKRAQAAGLIAGGMAPMSPVSESRGITLFEWAVKYMRNLNSRSPIEGADGRSLLEPTSATQQCQSGCKSALNVPPVLASPEAPVTLPDDSPQTPSPSSGQQPQRGLTTESRPIGSNKPSILFATDTDIGRKPYSITLANGKLLEYSEEDICEPPNINRCISNVKTMYTIWDDSSPEWKGGSPLKVGSQSVAVKHWPAFYKNFKKSRIFWDRIKENWRNWKIVMDEYAKLGSVAFGQKWAAPDGSLMSSSVIRKELRKEAKAQTTAYALLAKDIFPGAIYKANFKCSTDLGVAKQLQRMKADGHPLVTAVLNSHS